MISNAVSRQATDKMHGTCFEAQATPMQEQGEDASKVAEDQR